MKVILNKRRKKHLILFLLIGLSTFALPTYSRIENVFEKEYVDTSTELNSPPIEENIDEISYDEYFEENYPENLNKQKNSFSFPKLSNLMNNLTMVALMLLSLLFLVKSMVYKTKLKGGLFNEDPNFFNGLTDKFKGSITNIDGLVLKQMLALAPGQNLYLVELNGKQVLLGGTHNGGIQFVSDLSSENIPNQELFSEEDLLQKIETKPDNEGGPKKVEEINNIENIEMTHLDNGLKTGKYMPEELIETPFLQQVSEHMDNIEKSRVSKPTMSVEENNTIAEIKKKRRPFKRRVSFRRSLLSS